MRRHGLALLAALALACSASSDGNGNGVGPDPDAIAQAELAAVRGSLYEALSDDPLYPTLSLLVFPFIDRASHLVPAPGDTTRLVGIELDIHVTTVEGEPLDAEFTALLGWRGFRPDTRTVDSVFFVLGAGRAPVNDALGESFSPDLPGSGTAVIVHQTADSTITVWKTGTGSLVTTASAYGAATTQTAGSLTLSAARGTLSGTFAVTRADRVPDAATSTGTAKDFPSGIRALRLAIGGNFTSPPAAAPATRR